MSTGSCVSNWDSSTDSSNSTTTGSTNNSCAVSWNRSLSNDSDLGQPDTGSHMLFKKEYQLSGSHPLMWHTEDQQAYCSTDINRSGIWSTRFQSPEDHQLIDELFMKESADQGINVKFHTLSLSSDEEMSRKNFDRAIQPPQPRLTQQASLNPSKFRKGF